MHRPLRPVAGHRVGGRDRGPAGMEMVARRQLLGIRCLMGFLPRVGALPLRQDDLEVMGTGEVQDAPLAIGAKPAVDRRPPIAPRPLRAWKLRALRQCS